MIELFVKRPAMTMMMVLVFVVLGIVSSNKLIIENAPKIDFPFVTVKTIYAGATPEEVETQIIKKIEDAIAEISQIKKPIKIKNPTIIVKTGKNAIIILQFFPPAVFSLVHLLIFGKRVIFFLWL